MEPVIVQFVKFTPLTPDKIYRAMILAKDISSIEECRIQAIDEDGSKEYDFICIALANGTTINVSESLETVEQKWSDALKLMQGVSFDV